MKKLTKIQGKTIATLINDVQCAELMRDAAFEKKDWEMQDRWDTNWCKAMIELGDLGIKLPNYDIALGRMARLQKESL